MLQGVGDWARGCAASLSAGRASAQSACEVQRGEGTPAGVEVVRWVGVTARVLVEGDAEQVWEAEWKEARMRRQR